MIASNSKLNLDKNEGHKSGNEEYEDEDVDGNVNDKASIAYSDETAGEECEKEDDDNILNKNP
jgi:hypothetical protein